MITLRRALFLVFFSSLAVFSQTKGTIESVSLHEKDLVILGENRKGPYFLPDSLIIENSERVFVNSSQKAREDYTINYIKGEIRFKENVEKDAEIRLIYKIFPYKIETSYYHRQLLRRELGAPTGAFELDRPQAPNPEEDFAANLDKSGSITRGVTMGNNRGLKVNSALNINISGQVADNVEVVAALTDQTTPIQPEGTTQNLQEIDKVFVQIKAPHVTTTMGDFELDFSQTQFARYSRKLQGAKAHTFFDNFQATFSGAVSRGTYYSMQFMGMEGNQGPYQLKGDRGQIDIIVLAGTERVYIDGETMVRGETNDYIIDYAAAQITFTRHRLITAESRIVVDFQYSDEKFRRSIYSVNTQGQFFDERLKIGATFIREADDKENPLDYSLTDEYRAILRDAGDESQKAALDGAQYVGDGNGRYIISEEGYFVYAGQDSGNYNVTFSDVGDGNGDYRYKGSGLFEYVGEKSGRYAPVLLLSTAKSHQVVDVQVKVNPLKFLSVQGEIGLSSLDENSYSDMDDDDNSGLAQEWQLALKPDSLSAFGLRLGTISLTSKYRKINNRFNDIDRTTTVEYNRKWDLPTEADREESVTEHSAEYTPIKGLTISGELGDISKGSYFVSNRWQAGTSLKRSSLPQVDYKIERIFKENTTTKQNGDWLRQRAKANYSLWGIKPTIDYESELKQENWSDSLYTGFRFNDYSGGLETRLFSKLTASANLSYRQDDDYIGLDSFAEKSTAVTQNYKLNLNKVKSFTASAEFTHREKSFADTTISDKLADLAEIRMQITPWKRAINASWNYQIANTATAKKEKVYIKVNQGDGNFRYDEELNEYVNDPLGDYIYRILLTDEFVPVIELKTSARLRFEPQRFYKKTNKKSLIKSVATFFSTESFISIDEKSQEKNVWDIYSLQMDKFRQEGSTIFGTIQFRQDLFLFENNRDLKVRLRHYNRDELNNQFLEGGQTRTQQENTVRITSKLSRKFSSQTEISQKQTKRTFAFAGRQDRDIFGQNIKFDISYRPKSKLEFALEGRYAEEEDRVYEQPTVVKSMAFIPRVNYSLKSKGRLRSEFEWSNVTAKPADRLIPYEMADGRSIGRSFRWDVRFEYMLSKTMRATFSYTGRNEPARDRTIHTGQAQITAAFR